MTGNNKVWRAPLAGLAAVAMLATMGVAASTANAASIKTVKVSFPGLSTPVTVDYGSSVNDALATLTSGTSVASAPSGQVLVGFTGVDSFNTPLTGNVTLTPKFVPSADAIPVTIDYNGRFSALDGQGKFFTNVDGANVPAYTVYAEKNGSLSDQFAPIDEAGDGYVASAFDVTRTTAAGSTNTEATPVKVADFGSIAVKNADKIAVTPNKTATTNKAKLAEFDFSSYPAVNVAGAYVDWPSHNKDRWLSVDVAADTEFATPTFSVDPTFSGATIPTSWTRRDDDTKTVAAGKATKVSDDTEFYASEEQAAGQVTFYNYDGSVFNSQQVLLNKSDANGNKNVYGTVESFKDPERVGYIFLGWKRTDAEAKDATKVYTTAELVRGDELVSKNGATFAAQFEQDTDSKITVTFRDATYKGSHDDVVVDVNVGKVWDGTGAPTWDDRDGYYFAGWSTVSNDTLTAEGKPAHEYKFNQLISSNQASFVLYAIYGQNDYDDVPAALKYVGTGEAVKTVDTNGQAVDGAKTTDESNYFTDASFAEFKKVWDKVNNEYAEAQYKAQSNKIDAATSTNLVNELKDAWKGLRFTAENADTVLDGKDTKSDATAKVVYRLAQGSSRHLLTGDEVEVKALTNKYIGQGGWTLDNTTFRTVSNYVPVTKGGEITGYKVSHPEWVSGTDENKKTGFDGLLLEVSRLYNGREHMYTSDAVEIDALVSSGKWTKDSNLASFYVPAQYTTSTRIVRLY
ncbi:hypothetical protein COO72_07875, partial [Bifidobacterium callitrichos]